MNDVEFKNMSGHGDFSVPPKEIKGWNWGAFWLNWIWGIGNRSYIALLCLIPILNIVVPFYLGINGNKLAWANKQWCSIEEFKDTQKKWTKWGWGFAGIIALIFISSLVEGYKTQKQCEEIGTRVIAQLESSIEVKGILEDGYKILSGPSLIKVATNLDKQTVGGTMIIQAADEILFVNFDIDDEDTVKKITISLGQDTSKPSIEIYP